MDLLTLEKCLLYAAIILIILFNNLSLIIGFIFMIFGAFFVISGSLGLLRLGDIYSKIHAVGVTDVMGVTMMILGTAFLIPWSIVNVKMLLIILLLWIISPLTAHLLARFVILKKQSNATMRNTPDIYVNTVLAKTSIDSCAVNANFNKNNTDNILSKVNHTSQRINTKESTQDRVQVNIDVNSTQIKLKKNSKTKGK